MRNIIRAAGFGMLAVFAISANAQSTFPSQPIKVIVPFPPGGGTDSVTRLILDKVRISTGWTLIVENKAGAGGNIGLDAVAKSTPNGYTLGMGQTANMAINPALYTKMPYDPSKAFAPVALVAGQPVVLVVNGASRLRTLADLVNSAKSSPNTLTMASAGSGTVGHLTGEALSRQTGIQTTHIPYKGAGAATTDLLGGQVDYYFATPQSVLSFIKAGKLRALAVSSAQRLPVIPDVPTVAESGYKGFSTSDWKMLVAPAGTPPEILDKLHAELSKALARSDTIATLQAEGSSPIHSSRQEAISFLEMEQKKWSKVVRESNAKPD